MMQKLDEEKIDKIINGIGNDEDSEKVAAWFATKEGQLYLSRRMDEEFYTDKDLLETLMETQDIPSDDIYEKIEKRLFVKKIIKIGSYAAAILLPLIIVFWGLNKLDSRVDLFGDAEYVDVYTPKGERMQIVFPDGSVAYLNSDTKLRYPKKFAFSDRKVYLDGEAYFEIEKNASRPFIVELDSVAVNVLGTSFNLEAYSSERNISLILDEGKVNLRPLSGTKKYTLDPGEKMIYDKVNGSCIILANNSYVSPSLWKDDVVYLKNKPLEEVIKVLDRKYDIRFEILEQEALKYSYTILISRNTPLEKVLLDLEKIAPVVFHLQNDKKKYSTPITRFHLSCVN
ncbi:FecR family protein [Dysgonomonas sp. 511]|uniref:FecR family protein n=1 Tax=Dysgonomonas sp. 511 TaxID=2302930 RepID=UPI0013D6ECD9|nr:FecR family protein [Dysgonomonas sp. 511]NDV78716.1 FecR family protein [Dysgonomonas sp. 511]